MKLNVELARKIVKEARSSVDEQFIIVDTTCHIIASSEPERLGDFHEGAKKAIDEDRMIAIYAEDVPFLKGVKAGISMPIKHQGEIIGVIGITGDPQDVQPYGDLIRRLTELFIREAIHNEQFELRRRGIEAFVYEWVYKETIEPSFVERGEILGFDFQIPYFVLMCELKKIPTDQVKSPSLSETIDQGLVEHLSELITNKNDHFVRWGHDHLLFLFKEAGFHRTTIYEKLLQWRVYYQKQGYDLKAGFAKKSYAHAIRHGFQEARQALQATTHDQPIVLFENLRLELLIQDLSQETRTLFLGSTWSYLEKETNLIETIQAFLKHNLSVTDTAKYLHVHENTVHYRLKKMKEKANIDLRTVEGVVIAYLALKINERYDPERGSYH